MEGGAEHVDGTHLQILIEHVQLILHHRGLPVELCNEG